MAKLKLF